MFSIALTIVYGHSLVFFLMPTSESLLNSSIIIKHYALDKLLYREKFLKMCSSLSKVSLY